MTRGREAMGPWAIPLTGWKDIALRIWSEMQRDHVGLVSAGVAFYCLLALFPAITAGMAVGGLVYEPQEVVEFLEAMTQSAPQEVSAIIIEQARAVADTSHASLSITATVGLALALYSASKSVKSLMDGLNIAYDEGETRGWLMRKVIRVGMTAVLLTGVLLAMTGMIGLSAALAWFDLDAGLELWLSAARWAALAVLAILGLSALYRYAPSRANARWRWLTPGAVVAGMLWLIASIAFGYYVQNFGSYNESFGALAGVVILLLWLWMSAFIVLMGAELNAEMEAQTRKDSTTGPERPMGERGAVKADRLGEACD